MKKRHFICFFICLFEVAFTPVSTQAQNSCNVDLFRSSHMSYSGAYSGFLAQLPSGEFMYNSLHFWDQTYIKTDVKGDLIWAKKYKVNAMNSSVSYKGAMDKTGHFVTSIAGDVLYTINENGEVLHSKKLKLTNQYVYVEQIKVAADNDKIVLVHDESTYFNEGYMLIRFSPDLSVMKWVKHFDANNLFFKDMEVTDQTVLLMGSLSEDGIFMAFDLNTGNILSQKLVWLEGGDKRYRVTQFKKYNNGYIALVETNDYYFRKHAIIRFDAQLQLLNAYYIDPANDEQNVLLLAEPSGAFHVAISGHTEFFSLLHITSGDSVVVSKRGQTAWWADPTDFIKTTSGYALLSNATFNAVGVGTFGFTMLTHFDANGNIGQTPYGCYAEDYPVQKTAANPAFSNASLTARDTSMITLVPESVEVEEKTFYQSYKSCYYVNDCHQLEIEGTASYCGEASGLYSAKRSKGCTLPVQWTVTGGPVTMEMLNDSSSSISFHQSGSYKIIASIENLCDTIRDTITVNVTLTGLQLSLGPDFSLCPSNTQVLNAKAGFTSYHWQNGSTDSTFLVTQPGTYYVTVTDACNNTFSDTVRITAAPPVSLSIGADRTKCNNDTLQLTAPAGFINYSWGPAYNINMTNTQQVVVNPAHDTIYFVKAEKTPGCFGFDTLRVKVNISPPVNLGPDVRFCKGDSVVLRAGNGFVSYAWSNGVTVPQTVIKTQGVYSVAATTSEGCTSRDTLEVLQVYANPVVTLNKDSLLCTGSSRVLDAGPSASYTWNTGQQTRTISITSTGTYSVTVTDANGCKGSDTTMIARLLPLPARFLGKDTSICSYGTLELQAAPGYKTYLWSTGAVTQKLSINRHGRYVLTVTDFYNCSGNDTIDVAQQQCLTGFYMPNVFTPNNDGLNDLIRPLLFGDVEVYEFTIYNRYGEVIFTTRRTGEGWNGTHKGLVQDPGTFSWKCNYQLKGEDKQQRSGTLHLMR